jgi:hypothetical protein
MPTLWRNPLLSASKWYILKMEAADCSVTFVPLYQTTLRRVPKRVICLCGLILFILVYSNKSLIFLLMQNYVYKYDTLLCSFCTMNAYVIQAVQKFSARLLSYYIYYIMYIKETTHWNELSLTEFL